MMKRPDLEMELWKTLNSAIVARDLAVRSPVGVMQDLESEPMLLCRGDGRCLDPRGFGNRTCVFCMVIPGDRNTSTGAQITHMAHLAFTGH